MTPMDLNGNGVFEPFELQANRASLIELFTSRLLVNADGRLCIPVIDGVQAEPGGTDLEFFLRYRCPAPPTRLRFEMHLFDGIVKDWANVGTLRWRDRVDQFLLRDGNAAWETARSSLEGESVGAQLRHFLELGIEHIFTGYDHLLFLVGLLLPGGRFWSLVKIVTAFTVAHSFTLILATLELVTLSPQPVEAAIALSIVYVGGENFFILGAVGRRDSKDLGTAANKRWIIAFVFGLIHGFAFASLLRELGLPRQGLVPSLLSFNIGVEIGQITVVAIVLPLIFLLQRQRWHRKAILALSALIVVCGLFWFSERIAG
jgi:hypothetical protein